MIKNFQKEYFNNTEKKDYFYNLIFNLIKNTNIILDIDGTLLPYNNNINNNKILQKNIEIINSLTHNKNDIYLCSNTFKTDRSQNIKNFIKQNINITIPIIKTYGLYKKPFLNLTHHITNPHKSLLVIGDLYLSEGLLAKWNNADFLWVESLTSKKDPYLYKWLVKTDSLIYNYYLQKNN